MRTRLTTENCLAAKYPEIAKEWSPENPFGPEDVTPGSSKKVLWVCQNGHPTYLMAVCARTTNHQGCPICGKIRINRNRKKKVRQYTMDGRFVAEYESQSEAARAIGVTPGTICSACSGRAQTAGAYLWKYAEEAADVTEVEPLEEYAMKMKRLPYWKKTAVDR